MMKQLSLAFAAVLLLASTGPSEGADPCDDPANVQAWTPWFDRDDPDGKGDWETLYKLRKENPGKICDTPTDIEALTVTGQTVDQAGEIIYSYDKTSGFICKNKDQPDRRCNDYKVRFSCPPAFCCYECWTGWYNEDNPSGTGDLEDLSSLQNKHSEICAEPKAIQAVTADADETPAILTGDNIYFYSPTNGFSCRNEDQTSGCCKDYKVRFACPCPT